MYNTSPEYRLEIVRYYLRHGSYRKTARKFHVSYRSVFKWVERYRKAGAQGVLNGYSRPWNRTSRELEERISLLKELDPSMTIAGAKRILEDEGIEISIKGIWGIWRRYGYAGFAREHLTNDWTRYCPWSAEASRGYRAAEVLFSEGDRKEAAQILNSIPSLPENDLMAEIPDNNLSPRRQAEKMDLLLGNVPLTDYLKMAGALSRELEGWVSTIPPCEWGSRR
jgi:transposase